ncbi:alpha-2-macroglobulin-like [Etheostoma spectabile]|uniref:alpha-2-macroglobulin-like n=1 Tax=Etheostoma spectabile TaxID=54343 RepID=UPI0013AEAE62|nr:alpha-2-macroglobulin-like [Etheostoma spectabile]
MCEQNMALLAPNIYILEYLKKHTAADPSHQGKGHQLPDQWLPEQLNYKDKDGAYSTFGAGPGNTWLTALCEIVCQSTVFHLH